MQWTQIRGLSLKDRTSLLRGLVPSNTICTGSGKGVKIYSTNQLTGITSYINSIGSLEMLTQCDQETE